MNDRGSGIADRLERGRWFLVALLLALASALVPALCASGPPASRTTGSAFDPGTSVVALRARAQALIQAEALREDSASKALPGRIDLPLIAASVAAVLVVGTALAHPLSGALPIAAPRMRARRLTRAQPRAPPLPDA